MRFSILFTLALLAGCASSRRSDSAPAAIVELSPGAVCSVGDSAFKSEIEEYHGVALVDFNARWCGPCRRMSPVIDALATDCKGRAKVLKLDIDAAVLTADRYDVHSIPCLIVFRDGREVERHYGLHTQPEIEAWIATAAK